MFMSSSLDNVNTGCLGLNVSQYDKSECGQQRTGGGQKMMYGEDEQDKCPEPTILIVEEEEPCLNVTLQKAMTLKAVCGHERPKTPTLTVRKATRVIMSKPERPAEKPQPCPHIHVCLRSDCDNRQCIAISDDQNGGQQEVEAESPISAAKAKRSKFFLEVHDD